VVCVAPQLALSVMSNVNNAPTRAHWPLVPSLDETKSSLKFSAGPLGEDDRTFRSTCVVMIPLFQPRAGIFFAPGQYLATPTFRAQSSVTSLRYPSALNARPHVKKKTVVVRSQMLVSDSQHLPRQFFISVLVSLLSLIISAGMPYG